LQHPFTHFACVSLLSYAIRGCSGNVIAAFC
jgi:hypothetical protein